MSLSEEVIDATLEADGSLKLAHPPQLPPGPVRVTIQAAQVVSGPRRTLADVIDEIAAGQRARGFPGRSAEELRAEEEAQAAEDEAYDGELEAARRPAQSGGG